MRGLACILPLAACVALLQVAWCKGRLGRPTWSRLCQASLNALALAFRTVSPRAL